MPPHLPSLNTPSVAPLLHRYRGSGRRQAQDLGTRRDQGECRYAACSCPSSISNLRMIESLQTYAETISKDGFPQGKSNAHRCIPQIWNRMSHLSHIGSNFACCRPEHRLGRDPQGSMINFDDAPPPYRFWSGIAVKVVATCHRFAATAQPHLPAASGDGLNFGPRHQVTIGPDSHVFAATTLILFAPASHRA